MCATVLPKSYYIGEGKQKRKKGCFAMKKLVLILTVMLLLGSLVFGAYASEQEECPDSSVVSDEILAQLDLQEGDQVVQYYHVDSIFRAFEEYENIHQLLAGNGETRAETGYVVYSPDGTVAFYLLQDGKMQKSGITFFKDLWDVYWNADVIQKVSADIEVYRAYIVTNEGPGCVGDLIYYETSMGDYVYFTEEWYNDDEYGEYLFAAEQFHAWCKAIIHYNIVANKEAAMIGGLEYTWWDRTEYDIKSGNFNPNAEFPRMEKTVQYLLQEQVVWRIFSDALILAAVVTLALLLRRRKAVSARVLLAIFLGISVFLVALDYLLLDGMLMRDSLSTFVKKGMNQVQVERLLGDPLRNVSYSGQSMEYGLPGDYFFYVDYDAAGTVRKTWEFDRTYPLRGMMLPAFLAWLALLIAAMYAVLRKWGKAGCLSSHTKLILRCVLVFLACLLVMNLLGHYVLRSLFPELYVYRGMEHTTIFWMFHDYPRTWIDVDTTAYNLLLGNTLTIQDDRNVTVETVVGWTHPIKSCHISGVGDPTYLQLCRPILLILSAVAALWFARKGKRYVPDREENV